MTPFALLMLLWLSSCDYQKVPVDVSVVSVSYSYSNSNGGRSIHSTLAWGGGGPPTRLGLGFASGDRPSSFSASTIENEEKHSRRTGHGLASPFSPTETTNVPSKKTNDDAKKENAEFYEGEKIKSTTESIGDVFDVLPENVDVNDVNIIDVDNNDVINEDAIFRLDTNDGRFQAGRLLQENDKPGPDRPLEKEGTDESESSSSSTLTTGAAAATITTGTTASSTPTPTTTRRDPSDSTVDNYEQTYETSEKKQKFIRKRK